MTTNLPRWLVRALPKRGRWHILRAAALVGINTDGTKVMLGQLIVDDVQTAMAISIRFTSSQYHRLERWGRDACMVSKAAILRTAIFIGLGLPDGRTGNCVKPEGWPQRLRKSVWKKIVAESGIRRMPNFAGDTEQPMYVHLGNDNMYW